MKNLLLVCSLWLFSALAFAATSDDPNDLVDVMRNLTSLGHDLGQFMQTISLLGGLIMVLAAYVKYKKKRGKPHKEVTPIIILFVIGTLAIAMYFVPTKDPLPVKASAFYMPG